MFAYHFQIIGDDRFYTDRFRLILKVLIRIQIHTGLTYIPLSGYRSEVVHFLANSVITQTSTKYLP